MPADVWTFDKSDPWFDQILDMERQGKPTTITAHMMAVEAQTRANGGKRSREPGSDDED